MPIRWSIIFAILLLFVPALTLSQVIGGGGIGSGTEIGSVGGTIYGITGRPYSATVMTTRVQTLADGTTITQESKQHVARDSQGRTRSEVYPQLAAAAQQDPNQRVFVSIIDPDGQQLIHLEVRGKTAIVTPFKTPEMAPHLQQGSVGHHKNPGEQPGSLSQRRPNPTPGHFSSEKLDGQTIGGVYAEGTRTTRVIPAGTPGNSGDITVITEIWRSPDLGIVVLTKTTDPRGDATTEVKDLDRGEPNPALFEIPADYKVITQGQEQN